MKLHLPRLLAAAVLAACVSSSVYAEGTPSSTSSGVTLPEGFDDVSSLDADIHLNGHRNNTGKKYMLLMINKAYSYDLSVMEKEWEDYNPYITGGSLYFTSALENSTDLRFKNGSRKAFYQLDKLVFDKLKYLEFSSMTSGAIYSDGESSPAELTISNISSGLDSPRDVYFYDNSITDNNGAAVCAVNTYVSILNNRRVEFSSNSTMLYATQDGWTETEGGESSIFDFVFDILYTLGFGFETPNITANGGAICLSASSLSIEDNQEIDFSYNRAEHSGGAIYAGDPSMDGLDIIVSINNNGNITFSGNEATGTMGETDTGTKLYEGNGGAICIEMYGQLSMNNNTGDITFENNKALQAGGAVYFRGNGPHMQHFIEWTGNTGDIIFNDNEAGVAGGAIFGDEHSNINIIGNTGDIFFERNQAGSYGGAICTYDSVSWLNPNKSFLNSTIRLADNEGNIIFRQNCAGYSNDEGKYLSGLGGAIYGNNLCINNNKSVLFERNVEIEDPDSYRLRSLYLTSPNAFTVSLSAAKDCSIQFNDSIFIDEKGTFVLNDNYTPTGAQESIRQEGDIIFSGATTEKDLKTVLDNWPHLDTTVKPEDVEKSRTSTVLCLTEVAGGRLRVEDSAIYESRGIKLRENSGATLLIKDAMVVNLDTDGETGISSSISVGKGTALEVHGLSTIQGGEIAFADGAEWRFGLSDRNVSNNAALFFDGMMSMDGGLTLTLDVSGSNMNEHYCLYKGTMDAYDNIKGQWTAGNIKVNGIHDATGAIFDDLVWRDGSLYYVSSMVWGNNKGTWLWNLEDLNWQNGRTFAHGMNVKFTDTAAGEVKLSGMLAAGVITVVNSKGHDYTFSAADEEGRLSQPIELVKRGTGALTLNLANDYTGLTHLEEGTLNLHDDKALGGSVLKTAAGTTLGVGDGAHVVLENVTNEYGEHQISGDVRVDDGATLEIKGNNDGYAASNTKVEGTLAFTGSLATAGKLEGNTGTVQVVDSKVSFNEVTDFHGHISVSGSSTLSTYYASTDATIDLYGATLIADYLILKEGGSLNMVSGTIADEQATVNSYGVYFCDGATLSAGQMEAALNFALDDVQRANSLLNNAVSSVMQTEKLQLDAGATLALDKVHLDLDGANLTLAVASDVKINLALTLDGTLMDGSSVVLFTGVNNLKLTYDETYVFDGTNGTFMARDYFTGDMIGNSTLMHYQNGTITMTGLVTPMVPEPTTATLSMLALAALVARRRRK